MFWTNFKEKIYDERKTIYKHLYKTVLMAFSNNMLSSTKHCHLSKNY